MLTGNQIKWAAEHDWYVDTSADNDAILVREIMPDLTTVELTWISNYKELREWAGY